MPRNIRSLQNRGYLENVNDATYVNKPIAFEETPPTNYNTTRGRKAYSYNDIGYNMYGQLIDYSTGNLISWDDARQKVIDNFIPTRLVLLRNRLQDMALDKYRANKKYKR
jgi:hypothetical protein